MGEMHRIMLENACTKDVFRELDGFLLIVNVLSILHAYFEKERQADVPPETTQTEDGERLAFMLLAESVSGHPSNQLFFEVSQLIAVSLTSYEPLLADTRWVRLPREIARSTHFRSSNSRSDFRLRVVRLAEQLCPLQHICTAAVN